MRGLQATSKKKLVVPRILLKMEPPRPFSGFGSPPSRSKKTNHPLQAEENNRLTVFLGEGRFREQKRAGQMKGRPNKIHKTGKKA